MNLVHPIYLYLLLAIPVLFGLFVLARIARKRKLMRFGQLSVIAHLMPDASKYKPWIKIITQLVIVASLVLVIVRPQYGEQEKKEFVPTGVEIMVAVDLSRSMEASSTSDPRSISRLQRAQHILDQLMERLQGNKVGLVVFAGDPHLRLSMTTDFWMLRDYINDLSPEDMPYQGTDLGQAITLCTSQFDLEDDTHKKAIILITDAEDHEGEAVELAQTAASNNIQINVVGLGSDPGAQIPLNEEKNDFLRDPATGNIVTTVLNEELAKEIASTGKGAYVDGADIDAADALMKSIDKLEKSDFETITYKASAEQFPLFALIALILMVIDIFVLDTKIGWLKKINFFTREKK